MSTDNAAHWTTLVTRPEAPIVRLLPVSGVEGAVYALTNLSRTPQPLGKAPVNETATAAVAAAAASTVGITGSVALLGWLAATLTIVLLLGFLLRALAKGTALADRNPLVERLRQGLPVERLTNLMRLS